MRRTVRLLLLACVTIPAAPAAADGPFWGWGTTAPPTTVWDPEAVADYLLTGQPPHPAVARIVCPEGSGTSLGSHG